MLSHIFILVSVILIIAYRWKNRKFVKLYNQIKSDLKCYPIIGHTYMLTGSDENRMETIRTIGRAASTPGIRGMWFANKLYSVVADPAVAEVVLKSCSEKDYTMKFMKSFIGNGTLIAPVPIWRVRRKILTTGFSVKILNGFVEIFSLKSKIMIDRLTRVGSDPISILKYLSPCTMDAVYKCILGIEIGTQKDPDNRVLNAWDDFRDIVTARACRPWIHPALIYNLLPMASKLEKHKSFLEGVADVVISQKMKEILEQDKPENIQNPNHITFLDNLIKTSQKIGGYTKSEILEETFVLKLASSDSSSVGASFTCLMLAKHPEVQQKVFEELQQVFGDSTRLITPEDLLKLKYLEAVIKETLRLYPPIPILVREVLEDVTLPSGVTLLKGTGSLINIWAIHRNPVYWGPDAEVFKAERFLDFNPEHQAQFIPFSYGPRSCLGPQFAMMLMKTTLAMILGKYKILPANAREEKIRTKFDLTMKAVDGFQVRLEPRNLSS